jgi:hypothetical protein
MDDEYELEMSPLCQTINANGRSVEVEIYTDGNNNWTLEIVDEDNTSIVWDEQFKSDKDALDYLLSEIEKEGLDALIDETPSAKMPH